MRAQSSWVSYLRQEADWVLAGAERAGAHWQTAKAGVRERATAIHLRGLGYELKKDYLAALTAYREMLVLYHSLSVESGDVTSALNDIADVERLTGDYAAAERDYREALRVARVVGDAGGEASLTGNLALLALDRKDWSAAEKLARTALPMSESIGRQELIADNCRRLAKALVRQGKPDEARPYAQRAVEIYTRLGSPRLEEAQATLDECDA